MQIAYEQLSEEDMLKRAKGHIFSTGLHDAASNLCNWNMQYGLAKIHYLQNSLGLEPNATFIAAPDATVTRNKQRWQDGFGYGGKIAWGEGNEKLVVLDTMPNACGMFVGGLTELPDPKKIIEGIEILNQQEDYIDDIKINWDFAVSNHFIDVFEFEPLTLEFDLPFRYALVIHSAASEFRGDNSSKYNFGLYYHRSKILQEIAETLKTPFGKIKFLTGEYANQYLDFFKYVSSISQKKRLIAAKHLFNDEISEITNPNHQGLLNLNEILLGSQNTKDESANRLFPLTLRADLPAYLMTGKVNFNEDSIEYLGFSKRADKYGVRHRLLHANIIPHGGGYMFPHILEVTNVFQTANGTRYFACDLAAGPVDTQQIIDSPREIQFVYRGRQVVSRTQELGLGTVVAKLIPKVVLKVG
ncbi:MAG: hypothetical protein ACFFCQ_04950 [Promethearchaeota archaeon]